MEIIEITRQQRHKREYVGFAKRFEEHPFPLSEKDARYILDDLCVKLGYCLPPDEQKRIISKPPATPRKFAKVVMEAEGVGTDDPQMFDPVFEFVTKAFLRASEKNQFEN